MDMLAPNAPSPYQFFDKDEWARFRADAPMTLNKADVEKLAGLNDPISIEEAERIYLPLSRLLSFYVESAQALHKKTAEFLGSDSSKVPFIIGIAGSVAVGKSTTARILEKLLERWPTSPRVDLVTTDGFLLPNEILEKRGIMERKGFPESYDRSAILNFLADVKAGKPRTSAPLYSHMEYDVIKGKRVMVENPDILILEGLNILQPGTLSSDGKAIPFTSDFLDFSIYIDAEERFLRKWYVERFQRLCETAFQDPESFFHRFSKLTNDEAVKMATDIWTSINLVNLENNILPTRPRADLILSKGITHEIETVALRKI